MPVNLQLKNRAAYMIVNKIAHRAVAFARRHRIDYDLLDCEMDLIATHLNGNPIDFQKLLDFDDANFGHDVFGIRKHIDRTTGQLTDCFSPRCSLPEGVEVVDL